MLCETRYHWHDRIGQIIRSRHYTWLPEGLGGKPVDEAMATLIADIRHVCREAGVQWGRVAAEGRDLFEREEASEAVSSESEAATADHLSFHNDSADHAETRRPPDIRESEVERGLMV